MSIEPYDVDAWPWAHDLALQTYPNGPLVDSDSAWILAQAGTELAVIRCPALGMTDYLADLHASVSLLRQGQAFLPATVADARSQDRSWAQIAAQLQVKPTTARRRYNTNQTQTSA